MLSSVVRLTAPLALLILVLSPPASARQPSFPGGDVDFLIAGRAAPRYFRGGRHYVLVTPGAPTTLRIWNRSAGTVEAVVSVDGRDVLDGQPADFRRHRGYLVPPHGYVDIEGWRLSPTEVAGFRFGAVAEAYAAKQGGASDIGVVGVAFFPEARPWPLPRWPGFPLPPSRPDWSRELPTIPALAVADGPAPVRPARPGPGVVFGERRPAPVRERRFVRAAAEPAALLVVNYNDRAGLRAAGLDLGVAPIEPPTEPSRARVDAHPDPVAEEAARRAAAEPFPRSPRAWSSPPPGWKQ